MEKLNQHILKFIITRLKDLDYNRYNTAESLGISYRTLTNYMNIWKRKTGEALVKPDYSMFATNKERLDYYNLRFISRFDKL